MTQDPAIILIRCHGYKHNNYRAPERIFNGGSAAWFETNGLRLLF